MLGNNILQANQIGCFLSSVFVMFDEYTLKKIDKILMFSIVICE